MESTLVTTHLQGKQQILTLLFLKRFLVLQCLLFGLALNFGQLNSARAQTTIAETAVRLSAVVRVSPAQIKLVWSAPTTTATFFYIWRRLKGATTWGNPLYTSTTAITSYDDNTAIVGVAYEYRVKRDANTFSFDGYVLAGIEVPAIESRGTIILIVDNTQSTYLTTDLSQLQSDLIGDGWQVHRHDVDPATTPPQIKAVIKADYLTDPSNVKAAFLIGNIPVPYSGDIAPDGHTDHEGAWPADVYYGDMFGTWTDTRVNHNTSFRPENRNIPGDGKFDQDVPPGTVNLQIGRADMSKLSYAYFNLSEGDLLRRYLRKDHQFRQKTFAVTERGFIEDEFYPYTGEAFADDGWIAFSALVGESNINSGADGSYFSTLATQDYLLGYACGGGSYYGAHRVGDIRNYAAQPVYSVFNILYGSYFGDWDNQDNFLRGAIAGDGYTLTSSWGVSYWPYHLMGLGETTGYVTINAEPDGAGVYTALMGDPTLRLHALAPATTLAATANGGAASLSWTASADAVLGYYIYRSASPSGPFTRISAQPVTATSFTDPAPLAGTATYMVRAIQLKSTSSGSYYNLSQGTFGTFTAPVINPIHASWLGTQSIAWDNAANWSTGLVPTSIDTVSIPAHTPFSPTVNGGFAVRSLALAASAQLTVAGGASLLVQDTPQLGVGTSAAPTSLTLVAGSATLPGGQFEVLDDASASAGLRLGIGTLLSVGDYAELRLLGNFTHAGGLATFAPLGRLSFAHDAVITTAIAHNLAGPLATTVGILALTDTRDNLTLSGVVQVLGQVQNQGSIITNGNLILLSSLGQQATLTPVLPAQSQALTLGSYTGAVQAQMYVDGSHNAGAGYRHLTAPMGNTTVAGLSARNFSPVINANYNSLGNVVTPFPNVFSYLEPRVASAPLPGLTGFDLGWFSPSTLSDPLPAGQGYAVHMPGNTTLSFNGLPYTSAAFHQLNLARGTNADAGWHLLGSPYAAPLNWDLVAAAGLSGLNSALYVFKTSGAYSGTYASYLPGGIGVNGGMAVVPVGQAFFVRTTSAASAATFTITIDNLLTTNATSNVQRGTADTRPRLTLALQNFGRTQAHQTAIYFQAGATVGNDASYDATYLAGPSQTLSLASLSSGEAYSINGLPTLIGTDVLVPLQLSASTGGSYELAVETLASLPSGYHAYLYDVLTGSYTDLASTPITRLSLVAGAPTSRYAVLFSTQLRVLATTPQALSQSLLLYPNPAHGTATLLLPQALRAGQATAIEVRNSLGQIVLTCTLPASLETIQFPLSGLAAGVYVVRAHTAIGPISRRLVVE